MNLYEINQEYQKLLDDLHDENGQLNTVAFSMLEQNELNLEKKVIQIASYIKNIDAEREAITSAKREMSERETRLKMRISALESYLLVNMEKRNITKISCPYFDIKLKKCPHSVNLYNEDLLPDEYKRMKVEVTPDKAKMLTEMKVGVIIPGANLVQNIKLDIR